MTNLKDYKIKFDKPEKPELLLKYAISCVCGAVLTSDEIVLDKAYKTLHEAAYEHGKNCKILTNLKCFGYHSKTKKDWIEWIEKLINASKGEPNGQRSTEK